MRRPARCAAVIVVADEVREARAVVALETTLIAHGFPAGEGVAVGLASERQIREADAVPATIGILDGEIRVGLSGDELERFDATARKAGPRDLAACVTQRAVGATTVGGTLAVSRAVGYDHARAGYGQPGRPSTIAGVNRRNEFHVRVRHEPPMRSFASRITKSRWRCFR